MRNIAPGLYDLLAEVGEDWDANHIRFRAGRQALDKSGPFQCIDVTSARGSSGWQIRRGVESPLKVLDADFEW